MNTAINSDVQEIIDSLGTGLRVEDAQRLHRLMACYPNVTITEFATLTKQSVLWVTKTLQLDKKLHTDILVRVVTGEIVLVNSFALSRLPPRDQLRMKSQWNLAPHEFVPRANALAKKTRERDRRKAA